MSVPRPLRDYLIAWPPAPDTERKSYFETTHRVISPEETLQRIAPLRERAGITRVADITGLDTIGIPVFNAVRPVVDLPAEHNTVYNGKGCTKIQAKVSALMEAFERYSAEHHNRPVVLENLGGMSHHGTAVDPRRLILAAGETYESREPLDWVCGRDLISGEVRFVPAAAVFFPYRPSNGGHFFRHFSDTNGLASGNSLPEAISHALAEVIERDASAIAVTHRKGRSIDASTIDSPLIQALVEKIREAKLNLHIKEITSDIRIPTYFAATDDPVTENPMLLNGGFGTHVNAEIALLRAITETVQSRLTVISGTREDISKKSPWKEAQVFGYHGLKKILRYWFHEDVFLKDFKSIPKVTNETHAEDIAMMLQALQRRHFDEVIVVDLTRPELNIPVVRVIVPGLEPTLEGVRRGPRAREGMIQRLGERLLSRMTRWGLENENFRQS